MKRKKIKQKNTAHQPRTNAGLATPDSLSRVTVDTFSLSNRPRRTSEEAAKPAAAHTLSFHYASPSGSLLPRGLFHTLTKAEEEKSA